ncbi:hypothetical protein JCM24511_04265 [Saitozyma sp. JCM 24511]|nr:hypothetical protein JCM24511_04265 [Saitozyma sp. JCM 24511]
MWLDIFELVHLLQSQSLNARAQNSRFIVSPCNSNGHQAKEAVTDTRLHASPHRRYDIRITGSAASGLSSEDIDITTVSLAAEDSQAAALSLVTIEEDSGAERTATLVQKHLNAVAREKRRRHPSSDGPFRPFVLSLGGMMETDARDALKLRNRS